MYNRLICFGLSLLVFAGLASCEKECVTSYDAVFYEPVYRTWDEIREDIGSETPRPIVNPGKIFARGDLFFINEVSEGIHIIDNSDPASPQNIKFINIPGSLDIAVSGDKLYSDNYSDLIVLDISDLDNVQEIDRVSGVFYDNSMGFWFDNSAERVITGWEETTEVYEFDCDEEIWLIDDVAFDGGIFESGGDPVLMANDAASSDAVGKSGSMARFALYTTNLFALNNFELHTFNTAGALTLENTLAIEWGVETLFPYGSHLFVGSMNGMHILDITNPVSPQFVSTYSHLTSCDPVVVEGDRAWVTLRSGTECQGFTNQLELIDISDLTQPQLLKIYEMYNPHGLGLASDLLFLCDGDEGLKIFDKTDPMDLQMVKHYSDINAFDVIPYGNILMLIGGDGFLQYDFSDVNDIQHISTIPVGG